MSNTLQIPVPSPEVEVADIIPNAQLYYLSEILAQVEDLVMPVWPLKDYVAVNPHWKWTDHHFLSARQRLRRVSDFELLPSLNIYREQFRSGELRLEYLPEAIREHAWEPHFASQEQIEFEVRALLEKDDASKNFDLPADHRLESPTNGSEPFQRIRPYSDYLQHWTGKDWTAVIRHEMGTFCSSFFDGGQAIWKTHLASAPFEAWSEYSKINRSPEIQGIRGFRSYVRSLPGDPVVAILQMLQSMKIPPAHWQPFLQALVYSLPGWFAYTRYLADANDNVDATSPFLELLAVRLSYEDALSQQYHFKVDWDTVTRDLPHQHEEETESLTRDSLIRSILLRTGELTWQSKLLEGLSLESEQCDTPQSRVEDSSSVRSEEQHRQRPTAQMVFCIDVRSERYRRQLESCDASIQTFGFAGFFGVPMQVVSFGEDSPRNQLPVLLQPQFAVIEEPDEAFTDSSWIAYRRNVSRSLRNLYKRFATAAASCFTFVESAGGWFAAALLKRTMSGPFRIQQPAFDGLRGLDADVVRPTMRGLNRQGITTSRQVDLAASILKNLGLTSQFARLIVLCGHESQTDNNPLAASLDCGACGGHSGATNARFAALLLNQPYIRQALTERGLKIPSDSIFMAGVHNTTTDAVRLFDCASVPSTHQSELAELLQNTERASQQTRLERMHGLGAGTESELLRKASDWSETRPEWGLAGNAAFIAAPREVTGRVDLQGRAFLHSYEQKKDPDGSVLELIMTAPMVVAHWINMQYYVSAVDPEHFGSGSKTLHNVVGKFGILSGSGGDLMTGLPWESLHTGEKYQHQPLRLLSVIAASRSSIDSVLEKHEFLRDLLANQWLHLICIEGGRSYRYRADGQWTPTEVDSVDSEAFTPSPMKERPSSPRQNEPGEGRQQRRQDKLVRVRGGSIAPSSVN